MSPGTIIILVLLVAAAVYAVMSYRKKLTSGCCGSGGGEIKEKKVKPADTNKSNYPHKAVLTVTGMTCSHCEARVQNALNRLNGVYAEVDLKSGKAQVLYKDGVETAQLEKAVRDAGYGVQKTEKNQ